MSDFPHSFVVGEGETEKEYQTRKLSAFKANDYLLKMKGMLAALMVKGGDTNAASLMNIIDAKTLETLIWPLMRDTATICTTDKVKMDKPDSMDKIFSADTLDDFYAVVWEVIKYNFGPFISKMAKNLFGLDLEQLAVLLRTQMASVGEKLSSALTSTQSIGSGSQ